MIKITDKYAILAFLEDGACGQNNMVVCAVIDTYRHEDATFSLCRWASEESFSLHKALGGLYSQEALDAMINKEMKFFEVRRVSVKEPLARVLFFVFFCSHITSMTSRSVVILQLTSPEFTHMTNDNQQPKIDYKLTEILGLASTIFRASPLTDMCATDSQISHIKKFSYFLRARKVPANWQHPKKPDGSYIPLFEGWRWNLDYPNWINERERYKAQWMVEDEEQGQSVPGWMTCFIAEYGPEPESCDYMPAWTPEEKTHWMMYETTSEGTPISPAFATDVELTLWLFENKAKSFGDRTQTYESWLEIIRGEAMT